jgi:hypothetical protein
VTSTATSSAWLLLEIGKMVAAAASHPRRRDGGFQSLPMHRGNKEGGGLGFWLGEKDGKGSPGLYL